MVNMKNAYKFSVGKTEGNIIKVLI